jgi:hypothetical protein
MAKKRFSNDMAYRISKIFAVLKFMYCTTYKPSIEYSENGIYLLIFDLIERFL